jgi:hypothetical protein
MGVASSVGGVPAVQAVVPVGGGARRSGLHASSSSRDAFDSERDLIAWKGGDGKTCHNNKP